MNDLGLGGLDLSASGILGNLLFSGIGFVAFVHGKKTASYSRMGIGLTMMIYPYFVQNTLAMFAIGAALTAALFFFRD